MSFSLLFKRESGEPLICGKSGAVPATVILPEVCHTLVTFRRLADGKATNWFRMRTGDKSGNLPNQNNHYFRVKSSMMLVLF
jgi:hypothetical protein